MRRRDWNFLLLGLPVLAACSLPLNTALRDWTRSASVAVAQSQQPPTDAALAVQQALSTYFQALGILWDGADLPFDDVGFTALAGRAGDPATARTILELRGVLRAASDDNPPRWLPRDNSSPAPAYEDRRLSRAIEAADGPVQSLLAALSASTATTRAVAAPQAGGSDDARLDPALRQVALEREEARSREAAARAAANARHVELLARISEGHALLAGRSDRLRQRSTELLVQQEEARLRRAMARSFLPPNATLAAATP